MSWFVTVNAAMVGRLPTSLHEAGVDGTVLDVGPFPL